MKFRQLSALVTTLGLAALSLFGAAAQAQPFPNKPLTMVVPWPAGGAADFVGRVIAKEMSTSLGQHIIIENNPGASGTLGTNKVMRAPADGYTLLVSSPEALILSPLLFNSAQYKADDTRTIIIVGRTGLMLVTRKDLPVSNMAELVALMKSGSGKPLSYCSPGNGSLYHLVAEKFNTIAGVTSVHVPYSGFPQCLNDLVGGTTIDFAFIPVAGAFAGFLEGDRIKSLAFLGDTPNRRFPKVPLASATKGFEGFAFSVWAGLHVSNQVPEAVAEVLSKHAFAALAKLDVKTTLEQSGSVLSLPMTLKQAHDDYLREVVTYTAIAKSVGLPKQ